MQCMRYLEWQNISGLSFAHSCSYSFVLIYFNIYQRNYHANTKKQVSIALKLWIRALRIKIILPRSLTLLFENHVKLIQNAIYEQIFAIAKQLQDRMYSHSVLCPKREREAIHLVCVCWYEQPGKYEKNKTKNRYCTKLLMNHFARKGLLSYNSYMPRNFLHSFTDDEPPEKSW